MTSVAVIGSGISGAAAAWALHVHSGHEVQLYEARERAGGHSATVEVAFNGTPIAVDTGFIVYNEDAYPELMALFTHLNVPTKQSDMSLGVSIGDGALEWGGDRPNALFAQRRNLLSPRFWRMLASILRFNAWAQRDLEDGMLKGLALGRYLQLRKYSNGFVEDYLVPMGAAIWSTPDAKLLDFPAESFVRFFVNHRLLQIRPPDWRTVRGGSREYVTRLLAPLEDRLRTSCAVTSIRRCNEGVEVTNVKGEKQSFDHVILATHSDTTRQLLVDADEAEASILDAVKYNPNDVWLHSDPTLMPQSHRVWSAWNYLSVARTAEAHNGVCVTYWMNKLQGLDRECPLFLTLNPIREPDASKVHFHTRYDHPQFDAAAHAAQARLPAVQGRRRVHFAGAWTGYGFHEDGVRSGLDAAQALGARIPWRVGL